MKHYVRAFFLLFALMMVGRVLGSYGEHWVFGYWGIPRSAAFDELSAGAEAHVGWLSYAVACSGLPEELTLLMLWLCGSAAFFLWRLRARVIEMEAIIARIKENECDYSGQGQLPARSTACS